MPNGEKPGGENGAGGFEDFDINLEGGFDLSDQEKEEWKSREEKEKERKEELAKQTAFHIYDNLQNLKNGKEINDNLVKVIPEGQEITNNLKALKHVDLMPIFAEYLKVKEEEDAEAAKLYLFFDVKNADIESLITKLESVSEDLNKDLIKDLLERDKLEKKFTKMTEFMNQTKTQVDEEGEEIPLPYERVYLSYANTFGELIDENKRAEDIYKMVISTNNFRQDEKTAFYYHLGIFLAEKKGYWIQLNNFKIK